MEQKLFTLYVDESGDDLIYDLEQWERNPNLETHCTLLGTIVPHNQKEQLKRELDEIKVDIFRTKEIVLHCVDIRFMRGPFACFYYNSAIYESFKSRMNTLTNNLHPYLICSSLDKRKWIEKFPRKKFFKDDPYEQAFEYLLERYAHFLNSLPEKNVVGKIVMEDRKVVSKNKRLKETLTRLKTYGNNYFSSEKFDKVSGKIEFHAKKLNIPGLQLSDYFVYPFYLNHKHPESENKHFDFLEQFIYPGEYARYGFKKWPI